MTSKWFERRRRRRRMRSLLLACTMCVIISLPDSDDLSDTNRFDINRLFARDKAHLRLTEECFYDFLDALQFPMYFRTQHRCRFSAIYGLSLLLKRLSYPCKFIDLKVYFGASEGTLCEIFNFMIDVMHQRFSHLLQLNVERMLGRIQRFTDAIVGKGCPLPHCWGFIDCTSRKICRPSVNQRVCYSGHEKYHCFKMQSIIAPNGLILDFYGPEPGSFHDMRVLALSNVIPKLEQLVINDVNYYVYGDAGYSVRSYIMAPFKPVVGEQQQIFNTTMGNYRSSVERGFGLITQNFAFVNYYREQEIFRSPVAKVYMIAGFLTNCKTCLEGNNSISMSFDCNPPDIYQYLSNEW